MTTERLETPCEDKDVMKLDEAGHAMALLASICVAESELRALQKSNPEILHKLAGQLIADHHLSIEVFGFDSPEVTARRQTAQRLLNLLPPNERHRLALESHMSTTEEDR